MCHILSCPNDFKPLLNSSVSSFASIYTHSRKWNLISWLLELSAKADTSAGFSLPFHSHNALCDFFALQHPLKWHILSVLWVVLMFCPFKRVTWFSDAPFLFSICVLVMHPFGGNSSLSPQRFIPGVALSVRRVSGAGARPVLAASLLKCLVMQSTFSCLQVPCGVNQRTIFKKQMKGKKNPTNQPTHSDILDVDKCCVALEMFPNKKWNQRVAEDCQKSCIFPIPLFFHHSHIANDSRWIFLEISRQIFENIFKKFPFWKHWYESKVWRGPSLWVFCSFLLFVGADTSFSPKSQAHFAAKENLLWN